ncbi:YkgJ family cysteine cluster protein [Cupriavidus taiwanensis]|uniref:YkgJ family cysteine cluster protein n=1 Tax=Cupriavidus taiwanensis TaxID=164546 RepID=UPI002161EA61|nr:YkgJ family cysteine cluster protein [Cupriavidus taiwanensis]
MNSQKIRFLRSRIPTFECTPGCHDCCGPVTTSTEEMSRLPIESDAEHEAAMANLSCPHLDTKRCSVYSKRPLICRLFGTTPRLACPNGSRPEEMIVSSSLTTPLSVASAWPKSRALHNRRQSWPAATW